MVTLSIGPVEGLTVDEQKKLNELQAVFNYHSAKNKVKDKYYEGHVSLGDVNIGIALPDGIKKLEAGCNWGQKAVDVLASRSQFDGFVGQNGTYNETLTSVMDANKIITEYMKACKDELKHGAVFATLSADDVIKCKIRFHSEMTAAALWNGEKGRIDCGLAIIDTMQDEKDESVWHPSLINFYTDDFLIVLKSTGGSWTAERYANKMGRPLMEPMTWNATSNKPFGRSRLKKPIRTLIDDYIRIMANATIALEFDTTPQKYLLGVTDDQYDQVISNKFKQYVGAILAATTNPETGNNPVVGQFPQGSLNPHIEKLRMTATQFSAATGLTVTDVGVVNDANPTSSEAILAQSQTLVLMAEQLNSGNGDALKTIAQMAMAIIGDKRLEDLTDEEKDIIPHFKNPAMPSVSATADAAIKIASARPEFASTDTFLEMNGFDQAEIRRIKAQEQRMRGQRVLLEMDE